MSFFSTFKSLFVGGLGVPEATTETYPSVEHEGFTITPTPQQEGSQYRICGTITKGEQSHTFIRADMLSSADACAEEMIRKARQMIDQQGDGIF